MRKKTRKAKLDDFGIGSFNTSGDFFKASERKDADDYEWYKIKDPCGLREVLHALGPDEGREVKGSQADGP